MLGGLYQSVLRAELTHRFGVEWGPILTGQAEIAGVPDELLVVFSKRSAAIGVAMAAKLDEFRQREGRAAVTVRTRRLGAGSLGRHPRSASPVTVPPIWRHGGRPKPPRSAGPSTSSTTPSSRPPVNVVPADVLTVDDVVQAVSAQRSSWGRPDVIQAICDRQRPVSQMSGHRWLDGIERSADLVLEHLVDLDPPSDTLRRESDGRSVWIEPTAPRFTSEAVLAQEEDIITWAMAAQADPPAPSTTVDRSGLDVMQGEAAAVGRRPRSAGVGGRPGRRRQDPHAHRGRQRPARPWSPGVRVGADSQCRSQPRT